jgi:hypothetical protein
MIGPLDVWPYHTDGLQTRPRAMANAAVQRQATIPDLEHALINEIS